MSSKMNNNNNNAKDWDEPQFRKYDVRLKPVPRLKSSDPQLEELICTGKPVIISDSNLVAPAMKWDLNYLRDNMPDTPCAVIKSNNHVFKYYDEDLVTPLLRDTFQPPNYKVTMKIGEFVKKWKDWKEGDERMYLQQLLNKSVGPNIRRDYLLFKWDFINEVQKKTGWGPITSNLLLIAMEGNVTPCHYDEQENLFAQIKGCKRILLFPPEQFECLYPHPVWHPHDRQSQVDFDRPDLAKYPKFKDLQGEEAIVHPGDVLYIPNCWWHHVESSLNGGYTVSVNFWYKAAPVGNIIYPLTGTQKMTIMRNVEKMLVKALVDPEEIGPMLRALVLGRYTDLSEQK